MCWSAAAAASGKRSAVADATRAARTSGVDVSGGHHVGWFGGKAAGRWGRCTRWSQVAIEAMAHLVR